MHIDILPSVGAEHPVGSGPAVSGPGEHSFGQLLGQLGADKGAPSESAPHLPPAGSKAATGKGPAAPDSEKEQNDAREAAAVGSGPTAAPPGMVALAMGHAVAAAVPLHSIPLVKGSSAPGGATAVASSAQPAASALPQNGAMFAPASAIAAVAQVPGAASPTKQIAAAMADHSATHATGGAATPMSLAQATTSAILPQSAPPSVAPTAAAFAAPITDPTATAPVTAAPNAAMPVVPIAPAAFSLAPLAGAANTAAPTSPAAPSSPKTKPSDDPMRPQAAALEAQLAAKGIVQAPSNAGAAATTAPSLVAAGPHGMVAVASAPGTTAAVAAPTSGTPMPALSSKIDLSGKFADAVAAAPATQSGITSHGAAGSAKPGEAHATSVAAPDSAHPAAHADAMQPAKPAASTALAAPANPGKQQDATAPAAPDQPSAPSGAAPGASGTQNAPLVAVQQPAAQASAPPASANVLVAHPALSPAGEQLAFNLKRAAKDGDNRIQIELNPASLGKIEVRLDFSRDGHFSAAISADRPDTLQLLNSDSRALEQSLRDAGLRADSSSLSFNLRGGDTGAGQQQFAQSSSYRAPTIQRAPKELPSVVRAVTAARAVRHDGNLDIHV